jgi:peptidoglycan/LPS O-acetylase OafA/YrhL
LIEGLRAFAVIAVVANHLGPRRMPSGYLGVDIFFVISGFVITRSLQANVGDNQRLFFSRFFAKRIARILPALFICIGSAILLVALFVQPLSINYWTNAVTGISSTVGLSNMFLIAEQSNYFSSLSGFNFFTHTWSLCVEIQFYLLFPFIFLTKLNSNVKRTFAIRFTVIAVLSVLSLFTFVLIHSMNPTTVYYLMPTRFWEFGAGSMACLLAPKLNNQLAKLGANIVRGSLVILILVMFAPEKLNMFATIVAVLAASFCVLLPSPASGITTVLTSRVALWIGERSYSIYLWHWVVLTTAKWTIGVTALSTPFILASIFCCSIFSFRHVEEPFRRWSNDANNRSVYKRGIGMAAGGAIFVMAVAFPLRGAFFLGKNDAEFQTSKSILSSGCDIRKAVDNDDFSLNSCESGAIRSDINIFLIGDSHSKQFEDPIRNMAFRNGMRLVSVWGSGCPFPQVETADAVCKAGVERVQSQVISEAKAGDLVIVANQLLNYLSSDEVINAGVKKDSEVVDKGELAKYVSELESFAKAINEHGARVVAYLDGVQYPGLAVGALCTEEWFRPRIPKTCYRSKSQYLATRSPIEGAIRTLQEKSLLRIWDGVRFSQCDVDNCIGTRMSDSNHFTDWFTWAVVRDSEDWLLSPR